MSEARIVAAVAALEEDSIFLCAVIVEVPVAEALRERHKVARPACGIQQNARVVMQLAGLRGFQREIQAILRSRLHEILNRQDHFYVFILCLPVRNLGPLNQIL